MVLVQQMAAGLHAVLRRQGCEPAAMLPSLAADALWGRSLLGSCSFATLGRPASEDRQNREEGLPLWRRPVIGRTC